MRLSYPSSSKTGPKDWNKIDKEAGEDKQGDEAAVNSFFQNIFANASDESKRAMMKSFTESNGTVLSTNWDEVGQSKVEMKTPDGMEAKKV